MPTAQRCTFTRLGGSSSRIGLLVKCWWCTTQAALARSSGNRSAGSPPRGIRLRNRRRGRTAWRSSPDAHPCRSMRDPWRYGCGKHPTGHHPAGNGSDATRIAVALGNAAGGPSAMHGGDSGDQGWLLDVLDEAGWEVVGWGNREAAWLFRRGTQIRPIAAPTLIEAVRIFLIQEELL